MLIWGSYLRHFFIPSYAAALAISARRTPHMNSWYGGGHEGMLGKLRELEAVLCAASLVSATWRDGCGNKGTIAKRQ